MVWISSKISKRWTEVSRGATIPSRTPSPLTDNISMMISLPITSFSPTCRFKTNIFHSGQWLVNRVIALRQHQLGAPHGAGSDDQRRSKIERRLSPLGRDPCDCQQQRNLTGRQPQAGLNLLR